MNVGIIIRVVLVAAFAAGAIRLLGKARIQRAQWRQREAGLDLAQLWWSRTNSGPFDQDLRQPPEQAVPYLGPKGPKLHLRSPRPAMAEFVWGWILLVLAVLLFVTIVAELSSGVL